jgi:hypothetical protein
MRLARALALYLLATLAFTWPLAQRLHVMEPGDSAFFAWAMAWEIHALKTDPGRLPHGNIYHPATHTIGMDEPVLGTMLLALPFSLATDDAVLLFSLARLLTYLLSALGAYLLARELGASEGAALFAGALFAFSPIRTDKIAHLNTLGSQWLPLCVLFLVRFARDGLARQALLAAGFFVLTAYACGYYGMIGTLGAATGRAARGAPGGAGAAAAALAACRGVRPGAVLPQPRRRRVLFGLAGESARDERRQPAVR